MQTERVHVASSRPPTITSTETDNRDRAQVKLQDQKTPEKIFKDHI